MRTILAALLIFACANSVRAQPGQVPPAQYPQPYPPAPYVYQPQLQLSEEDRELLEQGEISDGQQIAGGLVEIWLGFGLGQAVQGRWHDTGWIFTLGESASFAVLFGALIDAVGGECIGGNSCSNYSGGNYDRDTTLIVAGLLGLTAFRVWGTIDAFTGPSTHNERLRALRARLGYPQTQRYSLAPFIAPLHGGDHGSVAGLTLRF